MLCLLLAWEQVRQGPGSGCRSGIAQVGVNQQWGQEACALEGGGSSNRQWRAVCELRALRLARRLLAIRAQGLQSSGQGLGMQQVTQAVRQVVACEGLGWQEKRHAGAGDAGEAFTHAAGRPCICCYRLAMRMDGWMN